MVVFFLSNNLQTYFKDMQNENEYNLLMSINFHVLQDTRREFFLAASC